MFEFESSEDWLEICCICPDVLRFVVRSYDNERGTQDTRLVFQLGSKLVTIAPNFKVMA